MVRDMKETIITSVTVISILVILAFGVFKASFCQLNPQYEKSITVDSYSKIDEAISNAVADVRRRNFEVVQVRVLHRSFNSKFMVTCGGVDRSRLQTFDK